MDDLQTQTTLRCEHLQLLSSLHTVVAFHGSMHGISGNGHECVRVDNGRLSTVGDIKII